MSANNKSRNTKLRDVYAHVIENKENLKRVKSKNDRDSRAMKRGTNKDYESILTPMGDHRSTCIRTSGEQTSLRVRPATKTIKMARIDDDSSDTNGNGENGEGDVSSLRRVAYLILIHIETHILEKSSEMLFGSETARRRTRVLLFFKVKPDHGKHHFADFLFLISTSRCRNPQTSQAMMMMSPQFVRKRVGRSFTTSL